MGISVGLVFLKYVDVQRKAANPINEFAAKFLGMVSL